MEQTPQPLDPQLLEPVVWTGSPRVLEAPLPMRVAALVLFAVSIVAACFAIVIALALDSPPKSPLLLAMWCASLGLACIQVPKLWLARVRYIVTEKHVILQRGPFRRTIERRAISFARVVWNRRSPGIGDLDLVRAVPTGALKRRLLLQLRGVAAPDQVWAIIRGAQASFLPHDGARPLAQRLDDGERVIWSAQPRPTRFRHFPHTTRDHGTLALALILFFVFGSMLHRSVPNVKMLMAAGLPQESSAAAVALVVGEGLALAIVLLGAAYFFYDAVIAPARRLDQTRYLITDQRVLIQRGREELHLDRSRIVDVIPAPSPKGLSNVFLVLDGPRARALAVSGAFGDSERGQELKPVFESLEDAESVTRILLAGRARSKVAA